MKSIALYAAIVLLAGCRSTGKAIRIYNADSPHVNSGRIIHVSDIDVRQAKNVERIP